MRAYAAFLGLLLLPEFDECRSKYAGRQREQSDPHNGNQRRGQLAKCRDRVDIPVANQELAECLMIGGVTVSRFVPIPVVS